MKIRNLMIPMFCICVLLCFAGGCVTAAKNLMKPVSTPISIPIMNQTIIPIETVVIAQPVVYIEGQDAYMFRTGGHWLEDWVEYKRDNVEGLKDIDLRATVYRALFLPNYRFWSVSWGEYQWQTPNPGMKYLVVFAHIYMAGDTEEKDPRMWGPGPDHFLVQIGNQTYLQDSNHVTGYRIKELEEQFDLNNVNRIYDYGYLRYYDSAGYEQSMPLGYIRMGISNAWDGFLMFEIPKETQMKDIKIYEAIDGLGTVWWRLVKHEL
jgi:hypothetical protein